MFPVAEQFRLRQLHLSSFVVHHQVFGPICNIVLVLRYMVIRPRTLPLHVCYCDKNEEKIWYIELVVVSKYCTLHVHYFNCISWPATV